MTEAPPLPLFGAGPFPHSAMQGVHGLQKHKSDQMSHVKCSPTRDCHEHNWLHSASRFAGILGSKHAISRCHDHLENMMMLSLIDIVP